jgi:hypothetical protein
MAIDLPSRTTSHLVSCDRRETTPEPSTKEQWMKFTTWLAAGLLCVTAVAADAPKGIAPRASADDYPAHAGQNGVTVGVKVLSAEETRRALTPDLNRCCLVVEVAIFPAKDGSVKVSLDDFVLRVVGSDDVTRPASAEILAGRLQRQSETPPAHSPDVSGSAGVTYEKDRYGHGTTTDASVGVGLGGPQPSPRAESDAARRAIQLELSAKALPEGSVSTPVAGYVYFSAERKKRFTYQLEYTLNGAKVVLPLP